MPQTNIDYSPTLAPRKRPAFRVLPTVFSLTFGLGIVAVNMVTPTAHAARRAEVSRVLGIELPGGASRFSDVDANFSNLLNSLAREKAVNQKPSGAVEAFVWRGANFRSDRVAFTRTAVKRALTAAGYTVTDVNQDQLRDVNIFEHFGSHIEGLPFRPDTTKRYYFFRAVQEEKGVAVLGAWLEGEDALALGLLPVAFRATPPPAPLPDVASPNAVLVRDINDTMKSLPPAKLPTFEKIAPKPGTVRGLVKDSGGRPIAGAEVAVYSSIGGGVRTTHKGRSNAQGLYEVLLSAGVAEVAEAKCKVTYNGVQYELPLQPVAGEYLQFNAKAGHVEHFVLRTSGEYGGTVRVLSGNLKGTIEITLTPVGRLLDGSTGRTLVYRYSAEKTETFLNGMPLGRYKLTARVLDEGDALPLQARPTFSDAEPGESLQVDFQSGYTFSQANPGKSNKGVVYFQVTVEP